MVKNVIDLILKHLDIDQVHVFFLILSPGSPVSTTNQIDRYNITEILLKVVLNTITLTYIIIYRFLRSRFLAVIIVIYVYFTGLQEESE